MNLQKTVIITGGTRGLGRAAAAFLLDAGWRVALNYVESIDAAKTLEESYGDKLLAFRGSIASEEDNQRFLEAVLNHFGRIDALVNSAGTTRFIPHTDLDALGEDEFHRTYDVNVVGAYRMVRACADCKLQLATEAAEEYRAVGIERLLADYDQTISLVPAGNSRLSRRNSSAAPKRKAKGGAA